MNRINNDWSDMLQMANDDLAKNEAKLEVMEDEEGYYSLYVTMKGKTKCFAENYFEDELDELINEAWAHAKAGSENKAKEKSYQLVVMLGTIADEMEKGGDAPTKREIDELYSIASELHDIIESL